MTNLVSKTALIAGLALGAAFVSPAAAKMAEDAFVTQQSAEAQLSSDLVGATVYNSFDDDAEAIGDVNNLVISADGSIEAVVIGVGGFVGIGEKDVAIQFDQVAFATSGDGEHRIIVEATKEDLEAAPAFEEDEQTASERKERSDAERAADEASEEVEEAADAASEEAEELTDDARNMAGGGADRDSTEMRADADAEAETNAEVRAEANLRSIAPADIRSSEFVGSRVYTPDDEWVGEVGDIVMDAEGKVDAVIIDFGGWLGIGEKEIAVDLDRLKFKTDSDNDRDLYVYVDATKEQLEDAPTFDAKGYEQDPEGFKLTAR